MKWPTTLSGLWLLAATATTTWAQNAPNPSTRNVEVGKLCDHPIYCKGPILDAVQMSGIFDSSKTFVDMPMKKPAKDILVAFDKLPKNPSKEVLSKFVDDNFCPAGVDIEAVELEDWTDSPPFLEGVTDPILRGYGMTMHNRWKKLARKTVAPKAYSGAESSLIQLNHTFFVTGQESSREFHYWDTYYIELGLLKSGLYKTAKGVVQNLLDMVNIYGFVPTGGRVYYTDRSEPPLLTMMVKAYYEETKDQDFVASALPLLKKEHEFWNSHRSYDIKYTKSGDSGYKLVKRQNSETSLYQSRLSFFGSLFTDSNFQPRPEKYEEDTDLYAKRGINVSEFSSAYIDSNSVRGSSESGTSPSVSQISKRHIDVNSFFGTSLRRRDINLGDYNPFAKYSKRELEYLSTASINDTLPIDLNAILYQSELTIIEFEKLLNNGSETPDCAKYRKISDDRLDAVLALSFDKNTGMFYNYFMSLCSKSNVWAGSSFWAYWAFGDKIPKKSAAAAFNIVSELQDKFPGGIPNTLFNTSLPWDLPNINPPIQHVFIQGTDTAAKKMGLEGMSDKLKGIRKGFVQNTFNTGFCNWYTSGGSIDGVLEPYTTGGPGLLYGSYKIGSNGYATGEGNAQDPGNYAWTNGISIWSFGQYKSDIQTPSCPDVELKFVKPAPTPAPTYAPPQSTYYSSPPTTRKCIPRRTCTQCKCLVRRRPLHRR